MREFSYGIIPLKYTSDRTFEVLLVKHQAGHWAFPKGHPNPGETPQQTAIRELQEETGLTIKHFFAEQPSLEENYFFFWNKKPINKTVIYYVAEVQGHVVLQLAEVQDSRWVSLEEAMLLITFKEGKKLCIEVQNFLLKQA